MKKFLSLALALVMCLSLVTISAGAKDFTDDSSINYDEAVGVMSGIGVIDGYTDGTFNPSATLTRGAAAKIICNMILGPTTASALSADAAPFKDVPANHTFAGYIAYCASQGIISGYADKSFRPAGTVTGYQFMKMLLGALGYDSSIEGFTGDNWSVAVAKLAVSLGLADGNDGFVGTAAMTREEACLYAFNTLMATMVEYDSTTNIVIGGTAVTVGGSKAQDVYSSLAAARNFKRGEVDGSKYSLQFAEKYFPNLTETSKYAEGRIGRTLKYKGNTVSAFGTTDDVLATSSNGTSLANLTTKSSKDYIDYEADTTVTYLKNDGITTQADVTTAAAKKGVVVNFLDTDSNGKYDAVSVVETMVSKLSAAPKTSTSGSVTKVTINGTRTVASSVDSDDIVYPEGLVKDDVVLYYLSNNGTTYVYNTETITGTMTASTASKITVDGTAYSISGLTGAKTISDLTTDAKAKSGTTYFLDAGGNICYFNLATDAVTLENTLFVRESEKAGYIYYAKVVYMDGSTGTIVVDKTALHNGSLKEVSDKGAGAMADGYLKDNTFYTYSKNDNNNYNLTACQYQGATAPSADDGAAKVITRGNATITMATPSATAYANAATAFVLEKGSVASGTFTAGTSYALYTGVANTAGYGDGVASDTPNVAVAYVLYNSSNSVLAVVGRNGVQDTTSTADYDVVIAVDGPSTVYKTNGEVDYYSFKAVVNGELVEEYKTSASTTLTLGVPVLVNGFDGDKANSIEGAAVNMQPSVAAIGVDISVTSNTLVLETAATPATVSKAAALADDAVFVVYNVADKTAEIMDPSDMTAEAGHYYTVQTVATSNTNSAVKYVFINDYAGVVPTLSAYTASVTLPSTTATLTVTCSQGYSVVASSDNTAIATVTPATLTASASVVITPVAAGNCNVTVSITNTVTGAITTYVVPVTVNPAP